MGMKNLAEVEEHLEEKKRKEEKNKRTQKAGEAAYLFDKNVFLLLCRWVKAMLLAEQEETFPKVQLMKRHPQDYQWKKSNCAMMLGWLLPST